MSEIWAGMRLFMADNKEIVPFISSVTALVAVFVGPMIQFRIAKIQHTANVVSGNRVRWIEEFRSEIAEFCTSMHLF